MKKYRSGLGQHLSLKCERGVKVCRVQSVSHQFKVRLSIPRSFVKNIIHIIKYRVIADFTNKLILRLLSLQDIVATVGIRATS